MLPACFNGFFAVEQGYEGFFEVVDAVFSEYFIDNVGFVAPEEHGPEFPDVFVEVFGCHLLDFFSCV